MTQYEEAQYLVSETLLKLAAARSQAAQYPDLWWVQRDYRAAQADHEAAKELLSETLKEDT